MPAASCRIMPARSISRCETISASFGFSLRMGRKNRDNRMGTPEESVRHGKPAVKPDRVRKHKGGDEENPLRLRISSRFRYDFNGCLLYTSDAADDLLCVDLGGRRIIKK